MSNSSEYDVVVLGAGGAGMMCAATAGQRGRRVLLLDHANAAGKKIRISGGGRCNFTNVDATPSRYLSKNPHFAKSALTRYQPQDFIDLVDRYGIAWHEKTLGQLFCDGSAQQIIDMLLDECIAGSVTIRLSSQIVEVGKPDGQFVIRTNAGVFRSAALVIATGGPSIPKLGATGFAYDLARQFGMRVVEPKPALVPLTLGVTDSNYRSLSGLSAETQVTCNNTAFREALLFTHKGLSGPAVLQISSYWSHGQPIRVDFLPGQESGWLVERKARTPKSRLKTVLAE
ncbi:MAG: aminoacetone oxidase family FAD-binding enzyme, partial [Myxococcota bacterium]